MDKHPPRLALRLFRWYCQEDRLEELEGDLREQFEIDVELKRSFPTLRFWWNVIRCAKVYSMGEKERLTQKNLIMLKSNIVLCLRNFRKNSLYGSLNIMGLSIAFAAIGLIIIHLHYELSFEQFHKKADRIYRVTYKTESKNGDVHWARVPVEYVNLLPEEVNGINTLIRFQNNERKYIKVGTRKFREDHVYRTDNEVFDVFSFDFVEGNPSTALSAPKSIVLTESLARKYFGEATGMGKEIQIVGEWDPTPVSYRVTGVIEDIPLNTHLPINMLLSFDGPAQRTWWSYTYILLDKQTETATLKPMIQSFVDKHSTNEVQEEFLVLQPLKDIHLKSSLAREIIPNGSWQNIKIFVAIGLLILTVGLINFTNISSVVFLSRLKEVGVRKVLGAIDVQLIVSVVIETAMYSLFSLVLGSVWIILSYPFFQQYTGSVLLMDLPVFFGVLLIIALITGLVAGIYPATISRRVQSLYLLKKYMPSVQIMGGSSFSIKKVMLTLQFSIAILLICCALIASDQFSYMKQQNLKMKPEQVLALPRIPNYVKDHYPAFKEKLGTIRGVEAVTACLQVPSSEIRDAGFFVVPEFHSSREEAPTFDIQVVGREFFDVMNIDLLAGSFFPEYIKTRMYPEFTADYSYLDYLAEQPRAYLINETGMKMLGVNDPQEILGKHASFDQIMKLKEGPIVGVVEDYHQASLRNAIDPTVYIYEPLWLNVILMRTQTNDMVNTIDRLETAWNELFPNFKLEYEFLDELYNQQYKSERKQLDLLFLFSILAVTIAFLGIFGLVAYVLKTKLKELAIRKVLGANAGSLIGLIGKQYLILLAIGLAIAIPFGIYAMDLWLDNFAYRIAISPISFMLSFALMILLLGSTIIFQTLKTASLNPVDSLKDE